MDILEKMNILFAQKNYNVLGFKLQCRNYYKSY